MLTIEQQNHDLHLGPNYVSLDSVTSGPNRIGAW